MKIVFLDRKTIGDVPNLSELKKFGDVSFYEMTGAHQTAERIKDADIVITNKVVLDEEQIRNSDNLKLICVAATGMNNIDLEAAEGQAIPVKNVADYASESVAQGTFAMIFHLMYNLPYYDQYVKSGNYSDSDIFTNLARNYGQLSNMQFGIIGLGNIGKRVAEIAKAFGAEATYFSTSGRNTEQPYRLLDLKELLQTSDIVSIHAPLNENTRGLLGYEELTLMKPEAILVNTGRGGIVNESDLARALDDDLIAGAGIDVFEQEPIAKENPLMKLKKREKLLLTPHMTWASAEARTALIDGILQNIEDFLSDMETD